MAEELEKYMVELVVGTRDPAPYSDELTQWVQYGASPRATAALDRCARARAWLNDRDYVDPQDIQAVAHDVLRHRIILSYEAEAEGVTSDRFIDELLQRVAVP
jgi:MoxR-like ATPase